MFVPGELVQVTAFHRDGDHNGAFVELNVGRRLVVAGYVLGSPDVRCRFPERPSRTVLVPASKLAKFANDPDTGEGPVGDAATVPVPSARKGYPPRRAA